MTPHELEANARVRDGDVNPGKTYCIKYGCFWNSEKE